MKETYWFITYTGGKLKPHTCTNLVIDVTPSEWAMFLFDREELPGGPYVVLYAEEITHSQYDEWINILLPTMGQTGKNIIDTTETSIMSEDQEKLIKILQNTVKNLNGVIDNHRRVEKVFVVCGFLDTKQISMAHDIVNSAKYKVDDYIAIDEKPRRTDDSWKEALFER